MKVEVKRIYQVPLLHPGSVVWATECPCPGEEDNAFVTINDSAVTLGRLLHLFIPRSDVLLVGDRV